MTEGIYFADAELPFHVWVRERSPEGYKWVLRDASGASESKAAEARDPRPDGEAAKR
jgi:hypothetical protein